MYNNSREILFLEKKQKLFHSFSSVLLRIKVLKGFTHKFVKLLRFQINKENLKINLNTIC